MRAVTFILFTLAFGACSRPVQLQSNVSRTPASNDTLVNLEHASEPLRENSWLYNPVEEEVVRLENSRITYLDYDLIRRDFIQTKTMSNSQIDDWILSQIAYISKPQQLQAKVNTPIPNSTRTRKAIRPSTYGRALVYQLDDPMGGDKSVGMIDVKGTGALKPRQGSHGNGLMSLGEAIREVAYENLVRDILKVEGLDYTTVGSYGVIDAGFDIVHPDGSTSPAGLYLRQAHFREEYSAQFGSFAESDEHFDKINKVFREYGIDIEGNLQMGNENNSLFDFGHYLVRDDLPDSNPAKLIPFQQWGYNKSVSNTGNERWFYSRHDWPFYWSHDLASNLKKDIANRHHVWLHFQNLLNPAREKWKNVQAQGVHKNCAQVFRQALRN